MGEGTAVAYRLIRERIPFLETDVVLYPLIEAARQLVSSGAIKRTAEERLGLD